jgi:CRP/FNR family transcriptional regulator
MQGARLEISVADHDGCKNAIDPLFLFACGVSWRNSADTEAGWELIRAAKSFGSQARTIGRALLAYSQEDLTGLEGQSGAGPVHGSAETGSNAWGWSPESWWGGGFRQEAAMNTPYGLEIVENCLSCNLRKDCAFCNFSPEVLKHFNSLGRISILPGGAVLFVEGQMPRGIFVLCAGKVKLSTTSKEGKVLILKIAVAGEVLGLSAVIAGTACELTAETALPCQVNFVEREALLRFIARHGEAGLHSAQALSKEFQSVYQDVHDLVMARSSAGKLAKLLLSWIPIRENGKEVRICSGLTHEEMAQMIGSSRETVTRLLSDLKKKQFIWLEGSMLVIRNRTALEALAS